MYAPIWWVRWSRPRVRKRVWYPRLTLLTGNRVNICCERTMSVQALRGMQGLEVHPVARIMEAVDQADRQAIRKDETAAGSRRQ